MATEIRNMTAADLGEVMALWERTEGMGLDPEVDEPAALGAYLGRNPQMSFVAEHEGRIVGAVLCGHDGRRGYLHHLAVSAECRHQGLGRKLAGRCLGALRAAGINKCHLFVFTKNSSAKAFWVKLGWQLRDDILLMSSGT